MLDSLGKSTEVILMSVVDILRSVSLWDSERVIGGKCMVLRFRSIWRYTKAELFYIICAGYFREKKGADYAGRGKWEKNKDRAGISGGKNSVQDDE